MNSYSTISECKKKDSHNQATEEKYSYIQRVLPPSNAIERENKIAVDKEKFSEFIEIQLNPAHPKFQDNLFHFLQMVEKIRLAVQSNLGLSAIERDKHETYHPIWVKKGKPDFPLLENNDIKPESILYDAQAIPPSGKRIANAMIIQDDSKDEGFSILYQTKFRRFALYIQENGKVNSSLALNWEKIYDDLAPEISGESQPLRSFTPWQRHSESNFFNGRSTDKILSYLSSAYPQIFLHNEISYYQDNPSEIIHLTKENYKKIETNYPNIYLTLDNSLIEPPQEIKKDHKQQPILVVIRRYSPLLGNIIQLAPAIYEDDKLHIVFQGHQHETEIVAIMSCDFEHQAIQRWILKKQDLCLHSKQSHRSVWKNLHLLKYHENQPFINKTASAPMVRGSDIVMRKYWLSSFDIPTVYTEMITIADIFNIENDISLSPQNRLEKFYYSDGATSSFRRLILSEYELQNAKNVAVQIVLPHETPHARFFWGEQGEHIARTTKMVATILFEMIPSAHHHKLRFAINMCCPAASIEKIGAGFGLRNKPEYIKYITEAIKDKYPELIIEIKTLMLSNEDQCISKINDEFKEHKAISATHPSEKHNISCENNKALSEMVSDAGISRLAWQGKPRNKEIYDLQKTLKISQSAKVNSNFNYSYSGMIAALKDKDLLKLGYENIDQPHQSVEGVLRHLEVLYKEKSPENFEVMLGRVLLGSAWLLLGRHATDQEILLTTLLQSFLLREFSLGAGDCGIDIMQIYLAYNLRHLSDERLRNQLMNAIFEVRSATKMIDCIHEKYLLTHHRDDLAEHSIIRPFILKLKTAVDLASGGECDIYTEREKSLLKVHVNKFKLLAPVIKDSVTKVDEQKEEKTGMKIK